MGKLHIPGDVLVMFEGETGDITDGYHSFNELYAHRCSLFILLMLITDSPAWRAKKDARGKSLSGWFLAGIETPGGVMVTYHLPDHMWGWLDDTRVETLEEGRPWDGHTSTDVIRRLADWCKTLGKKPEEPKNEED